MAPRLQGLWRADGRLSLALWGSGDLGRLRVAPPAGPLTYGPNMVEGRRGGLWAAQEAPALLVAGRIESRFAPARRPASWDDAAYPPARVETQPGLTLVELPWGRLALRAQGEETVIAAGADEAELARALALNPAEIRRQARAHAAACDGLEGADPLLRSLVRQGLHAALSSIRHAPDGGFAGLAAGLAYSAPARTYFRDGYWTLQALLPLRPEVVEAEIDLLAAGVRPDGEAPSGVIVSGPAQSAAWEALRRARPQVGRDSRRANEWWSDHFDSPLFFILAVDDLARVTGRTAAASRHWGIIAAIFRRYQALARSGGGLPLKPRHDRDWADNVYRAGAVAYDVGLWVGAADTVARLGATLEPALAAEARQAAAQARAAVHAALWAGAWYADYSRDGAAERHLTLDSLTLLRWNAVSETRARAVLAAAARRLETRANTDQPWGDWGVMCAFPPYGVRADLRAKSAFGFRYHNGADWPWLDGLYAGERLRRGLAGWRYPLTRWWETSLRNGWAGAVEYFSPPYAPGSPLQGWSSLPAAVAVAHRDRVLAGD
ncbi:hypothetical protein [Phenylobacterium sp.]|uniref:hypothetical protein n=1 Tax=Phenylobacterium sp. TaxID=1871053 RepID=UPI002FD8A5C7